MKRRNKLLDSFLSVLLTLSMILGAIPVPGITLEVYAEPTTVVSGSCGDDLTWTLDEEGVLTISGNGAMADYSYWVDNPAPWYGNEVNRVIIQDGVTSIGDYAFQGCSSLTDITIPDSLTSIGAYAFSYCTELSDVTISENVISLGSCVFEGCENLTDIYIPASVTDIVCGAFDYCNSLTNINVDANNSEFSSYEGVLFDKNKQTLIRCPEGKNGVYEIPESVTYVQEYAFLNCSGLTGISIPDSVTDIGVGVFYECSSLSSIDVDTNNNAFSSYEGVLFDKNRQTLISCPEGKNGVYEMPGSVTCIKDYAFYNCNGLTGISIPDSVTGIGDGAFENCRSLTDITIPDSVTCIEDDAFNNCSGLTGISIPAGMTSIGYNAFCNCSNLSDVYFAGMEEAWGEIGIDDGNELLVNATIHYNSIFVDGVTLAPATLALNIGETANLTATVSPNNATNRNVTWESSNTSVATVEDGVVTAAGVGEATITVRTVEGCKTATCNVTVTKVDVTGVTLEPATLALKIGETANLTATVSPNNATNRNVTWESSNTSVATVEDGVVTAAGVGEATITVTTVDGNKTATCNVTVTKVDVTGVNLAPVSLNLIAGRTGNLTATVSPNNATNRNVTWESSNISVATVEDGVVTAEGAGEATITVKTVDGNKTATCNVTVYRSCGENVYYQLDDNGLLTISGNGAITSHPWAPGDVNAVVIENGVTSIGDYTFYECSSLSSITIPANVTSIGDYAFFGCSSLSSITIPANVTSIGDYAFWGCSSLRSIIIPASVTSIGESAFDCISSDAEIYYEGNDTQFKAIAGKDNIPQANLKYKVAYGDCGADGNNVTWILWNNGNLEITGTGAMADYSDGLLVPWAGKYGKITNVTISNGVTSIGEHTFYYCINLSSITIPDSVTSIGKLAFYRCDSITNLTIPTGVTSISDYAFQNCDGLTNITILGNVTSIGEWTLSGCRSLTSITIPNSVTSIGDCAFYNCSSLRSIIIPAGVKSIGDYTFYSCGRLSSITIPDNVTSIGDYAFYDCSSLSSLTIPNSVTSIGDCAFYNCSSLRSIIIPAGVTSIGEAAFDFISSDAEIYYEGTKEQLSAIEGNDNIPQENLKYKVVNGDCGANDNNVTWILWEDGKLEIRGTGVMADYNSSDEVPWKDQRDNITNITISNGVTSIGDSAFEKCRGLSSITINTGVTEIGKSAFEDCSSLRSITIPASVTSIGTDAFENIPDNAVIYYEGTEEQLNAIEGKDNIPQENLKYKVVNGDCGANGNNVTWTLWENGKLEISGTGAMADYTSVLNAPWYSQKSSISTVVISAGVTSIGDNAFSECSSLISITIPDSVTTIGDGAFNGCTGLSDVYYAGTEEAWRYLISDNAPDADVIIHYGCGKNVYYALDDDGLLTISGEGAITGHPWTADDVKAVVIENGVTGIGESVFSFCSSLTSITIPDGVTSIGASAFRYCSGLTSITLPAGVTSIGADAFYDCSGLTSITIPAGVTSISEGIFVGCQNLTSLTLPAGVTSIGASAFFECSSLKSITIPDGVTSIGVDAFYNCLCLADVYYAGTKEKWENLINDNNTPDTNVIIHYGCGEKVYYVLDDDGLLTISGEGDITGRPWTASDVKTVVIENGVTGIVEYAFSFCSNLTSIMIPDSVTSIGEYAFYECSGLTSIEIPAGVTSIGESAFSGCSDLTSIEIPAGVTSIGEYAFYGCSGLTSIEIPAGVTSIGTGAFCGCSGLTSIEIPAGVTSIGAYAFYGCSGLTSIEIPAGVTSIGESAFYGCSGLTSIEIPASVTSIGDWIFDACNSLSDVYYAGTKEGWENLINDNNALDTNVIIHYGCGENVYYVLDDDGLLTISGEGAITSHPWTANDVKTVVIENDVTGIGDDTFSGCSSLISITISDSVIAIGDGAFNGCTSLTDVYYAGTKEEWKDLIDENNAPDANVKIHYGCGEKVYYVLDDDGLLTISGEGAITGHPWTAGDVKTVVIENGVTAIGDNAFSGCSSLISITISDSVTTIGDGAFNGCTSLTDVYYAGIKEEWEDLIDENNAPDANVKIHYSCGDNVRCVLDDDGLLTISGEGAITCHPWTANDVKTVVIENGVTGIGESVFSDCSNLTSITIPDSVTSIGAGAFYDCSGLTSIEIPASVTSIGVDAFYGIANDAEIYYEGTEEQFVAIAGNDNIPQANLKYKVDYGDCGADGNNVTWILWNNGNLEITGTGAMADYDDTYAPWYIQSDKITNVTISNGVTSIGEWEFYGCRSLPSITIPDSVDQIGDYAFRECSSLSSITIPDNVTSIGDYAFWGCSSLRSIIIPAGVTSIGEGAFVFISSDAEIYYEGTEEQLSAIEGKDNIYQEKLKYKVANGDCGANDNNVTWILWEDGKLEIRGIGVMADYNSSDEVPWKDQRDNITNITISNGVTSIGDSAFEKCRGLSSITINTGVTEIGKSAFEDCSSLRSITIPASITSIGTDAFKNIPDNAVIYFEGTEEQLNAIEGKDNIPQENLKYKVVNGDCGLNGNNVTWTLWENGKLEISGTGAMADYTSVLNAPWYSQKSSISTVVISAGVTSIGDNAFEGCTGLNGITIPNSVTSIGDSVFNGCTSLSDVYYAGTEEAWGNLISDNAPDADVIIHYGCGKNVYYTLDDDGLLTISGEGTITGQPWTEDDVKTVVIENGVIGIGESVFSDCSNLTSITIPDGVTSIGKQAFYNCSSLTSIEVPDSMTIIGEAAFSFCSNLTSITIPAGVTRISEAIFEGCTGLTSVTIPAGVTSIGASAFKYCSSLTGITLPAGVTSIGADAFYECSGLTSITIPAGVTSISERIFVGCQNLTSITIPDGVTRIGENAFYNCRYLTDVYYDGTVDSWDEINIQQGNDDLENATIHYTVPVDKVTLETETLSLKVRETAALTAIILPSYASNKNVTWESNKTSVAIVVNGVVTAVAPGEAVITVTTEDGNKTATCTVTVLDADVAVTGVTLSETTLSLKAGETGDLTATVAPKNATNKNVSWTSDNPSVATVANGTVTAVAPGEAVITVTTEDGNKTATCTVTVLDADAVITVTGVTLSETTLSLKAGQTGDLTATVAPKNATNKNVSWTSDNPSVATVANGTVTAVALGEAVITVTTEDGNKTATCTVTVTKADNPSDNPSDEPGDNPSDDPAVLPDASSVTFAKAAIYVEAGKSEKLSWTVLPADAKDKSVTFASSDTKIATVDSEGNVTGVAAGTAKITVKTTVGAYTDECTVTVIMEGLKEKTPDPEKVSSGDTIVDAKEETRKSETSIAYNGETVAVEVETGYQDAISYTGGKIDPAVVLKAKTDKASIVKNITLNERAAADGKTAEDMIKVSYVCSKKDAGNANFYAKLTVTKDAKKYMASSERKKLKKIVTALNKKLKKEKCSFTINKRSVTDGTLIINVKKDKTGAIKLKKGKVSKVKSIVLNTKDATGKDISIKMTSRDYKVDVIDAASGLVKITGKKNFTGSIVTYVQ